MCVVSCGERGFQYLDNDGSALALLFCARRVGCRVFNGTLPALTEARELIRCFSSSTHERCPWVSFLWKPNFHFMDMPRALI